MEPGQQPWLDLRFQDRPEVPPTTDPAGAWLRWRAARLAETVEWAAGYSPWYTRRLEPRLVSAIAEALKKLASASNSSPKDFGSLLSELPTATPADLAEDSDAFLAVGQDEVAGIVTVPTSGTSGQAKRIRSTAADLEETIAFFTYGMRFLAAPGGDRVALAMSPARPGNVGDLLGQALARWPIPFLAHGFVPEDDEGEDRWLRQLIDWGPSCLVGVPPQMLALSRHPLASQLAQSLKTMLLSGDVAEDRLVAELENNFSGCRVYRHYGLTEAGLGGAVECGQRAWPHLRDDLWVEILDPDSGRPVSEPSRAGEITLTTLTRRGMPLIRYRTGDEGRIITTPCVCGSILPRLQVFGRLADCFTLPSGRRMRMADFEAPLMALPFVRGYELKLHLQRPACLSVLLITPPEASEEDLRTVAAGIAHWLGPDAQGLELALEFKSRRAAETDGNQTLRPSGGKRRLLRSADDPAGLIFRC